MNKMLHRKILHHPTPQTERGVSLVIGVVVMSLILTTALAISSIFVGEIKNSRIYEKSTQAFYAADSGAEATLYNQRKNLAEQLGDGEYDCGDTNLGGLTFSDPLLSCTVEISAGGTVFRITGRYNQTEAQRKVEVRY